MAGGKFEKKNVEEEEEERERTIWRGPPADLLPAQAATRGGHGIVGA